MPRLRYSVLWTPLDLDTNGYSSDDGGDNDGLVDDNTVFDYYNLPSSWVNGEMAWVLQYCAPGELSVVDYNPRRISECREIQWNIGDWRPDAELHFMFQQIGREQHGDALKERWDDDEYGEGLVARWEFEDLTREERL